MLLPLCGLSSTSLADELLVDYKTFYSHVRKLDSEETNALQFAFGFINIRTKDLCEIKSARISTQKQQIPVEVSSENRFTLPSEKALRLADAVVILDLAVASNICDISVQLETKPEYLSNTYTTDKLDFLYKQYTAFFNDVGGFMSFMMPKVDGLTFQFSDKSLNENLTNEIQIINGMMLVQDDNFSKLDNVPLPNIPLRITAKTTK
jgi:hypothetical protein